MRALLAAVILAFCIGALSQEPSNHKTVAEPQHDAKQKEQAPEQKTATPKKDAAEEKKAASNDAEKNADEKLKIDREVAEYTRQLSIYTKELSKYTGDLSAFTLWLVGATLVLGVIGAVQGYFTWRSVNVAESALAHLERPYVVFVPGENVIREFVTTHGGNTYISFSKRNYPMICEFANRGRSPAILIELRAKTAKLPTGNLPEPVNPRTERGESLPMGIDLSGERTYRHTVTLDTYDMHEKLDIFVIGFIRYRDIFRKFHITGFCAKYNRKTNRFSLEGDRQYCYWDDEKEWSPPSPES